jgi:hypothetical protein
MGMAKFEARRYVGAGAFVPGIPARDLDGDEWAALDPSLREAAEMGGLYEIVPAKKAKSADAAPGAGRG